MKSINVILILICSISSSFSQNITLVEDLASGTNDLDTAVIIAKDINLGLARFDVSETQSHIIVCASDYE